jgi:hypothetical protein
VIGGAADHGVQVLLIQALAPVNVVLGLGEARGGEGQVLLIHVAEGDDVFLGEAVEVGFAAAPGAEEGDVELVAGRVGAEELRAGKD